MFEQTLETEELAEPQVTFEASPSRTSKKGLATAVIGAAGVAACGGGGTQTPGSVSSTSGAPIPTPTATPTAEESQAGALTSQQRAAARAALHSSLSVSVPDVTSIIDDGLEVWLNREMSRRSDGTAKDFFIAQGFDKIDTNAYWQRPFFFDHMIWSHLMRGGSGVRMRMALALSEIFVVSVNRLDLSWSAQAVGEYWDGLNNLAFGNFRDLLEFITLSPAMGVFLDHAGNMKADPSIGRLPDENFAREILQLFTIGLFELNIDGSFRSNSGSPIETYTNDDVQGLAKVFTGFDLDFSGTVLTPDPRGAGRRVPDVLTARRPMTSDPTRWRDPQSESTHSLEPKRFLGLTIPSGTGPKESLKMALDYLFTHSNVAPFFARQLIQRLVTSNPSPGYVERVAGAFENNGAGTRGDLGATFKAVITDPEALSIDGVGSPTFGKLREPMLRYAQWGRTFGARSASNTWQIRNLGDNGLLKQAPFRAPSVFNFFRPQYVPPRSQAAANGLVAPEFQLVDEDSVAGYVNFMRRTIDGTGFWTDDIEARYDAEQAMADDPDALLDHLDLLLTGGQLRAATRDLIRSAIEDVSVNPATDAEDRLKRVRIAVMLVMCCNDYLIQK
ncbi:hypothetical protein EH31_06590 [Erythrobacter longus]|uniref:DUF1800 domain-containing protein n=1 Tax=Erythrobacter longus TaxID=1044 RepID=A0A074M016_ERYLO|nr:DUF1800 family protein [Erythrobacter longus]KEO86734.1 hypothetical protein EH31_06590 [Erythrobacter longus]